MNLPRFPLKSGYQVASDMPDGKRKRSSDRGLEGNSSPADRDSETDLSARGTELSVRILTSKLRGFDQLISFVDAAMFHRIATTSFCTQPSM
jgi:hypothetical protein